eukprot:scaffold120186_cov19-Tisochrysis_lutea.AAC.1
MHNVGQTSNPVLQQLPYLSVLIAGAQMCSRTHAHTHTCTHTCTHSRSLSSVHQSCAQAHRCAHTTAVHGAVPDVPHHLWQKRGCRSARPPPGHTPARHCGAQAGVGITVKSSVGHHLPLHLISTAGLNQDGLDSFQF